MAEPATTRLVVVGSVGLDTIETPRARRERVLGGSASYACAAASFFTGTGMVAVVGTDFAEEHRAAYRRFGIDLAGLQTVEGETFRWSGVYEEDMNRRRTLSTELNVFASFRPRLPPAYRDQPFWFLANISPVLQRHVLDQVKRPRFVAADTMDLWINTEREALADVIGRVDLLALNDAEARHLTGVPSLVGAARRLLAMGPRHVLVKKGEHGSMLFGPERVFLMPAFPLEDLEDPTGAGDSFAGGLLGALAAGGDLTGPGLRRAMVYGSVVASFTVEKFGLDRLMEISARDIEERAAVLREMMSVE